MTNGFEALERPGARRYRVRGVLGRGGFGTVYRASMEGPEGFAKEVAIKLLKDERPPNEVLQRFRDEARVLGLIRDRAVVGVDPPVRLDGTGDSGRWAVVMEFVDGCSMSRLISAGGIPVRPAVEIVGEVARTLDKLWHIPGPDGRPLNLLHRDLKPANLQLTPSGEVKLLDFGIAKARFSTRESNTTQSVAGTAGYMAPERLAGTEGPTTDVFSLGVVLWELVFGVRPRLGQILEGETPVDPEAAAVVGLVRDMCNINPDHRPLPREVERRCRSLPVAADPSLREWADRAVSGVVAEEEDDLVGATLTETLSTHRAVVPRRSAFPWIAALVGLVLFSAGVLATLVIGALALRPVVPTVVTVPVASPKAPEATPLEEPSSVALTAPIVAPMADPVAPADPRPVTRPAPSAQVAGETAAVGNSPAPSATAAVVSPAPVATHEVLFASRPPDVEVWMNGRSLGVTPLRLSLPEGEHQVTLVAGDLRRVELVRVGLRRPGRHFWNVGEDTWSSGQ